MTSWSPQQDEALRAVESWLRDPDAPQIFRLFGYAGTGKTTLAKEMAKIAEDAAGGKKEAVYGAFTGKAALVLQSKGCHGASTIHSMIYTVQEGSGGVPRFVLNEGSDVKDAALVIIDECSMVGAELAHDLLSFKTKVLVLGDPAQLPPVQDAGFFTDAKPDVMLTEVHRQARDNPIIRMSMDVREGRDLIPGDTRFYGAGCCVLPRGDIGSDDILGADQVLVGMNRTRISYNRRIRELKNIKRREPVVGERLVCLRNNRTKHLFNGGIWQVKGPIKINVAAVRMVLTPEDAGTVTRDVDVKIHPYFFEGREGELTWEDRKEFDEFTFGYALTVHKSQGSQWNNVVLFNEAGAFRDDARRWLYTGITRAAEKLMVVL